MPWSGGAYGGKGIHIWDREPHYDTPALCGEWKEHHEVSKLPGHVSLDSFEEYLEANENHLCEECVVEAREQYLGVERP